MASYSKSVTGEDMVQTDQPHANIIFNDQEGILYTPQVDDQKVVAMFTKTFNPGLNKNFAWDSVKLNWTRSAPSTPMTGFKATFILEGILLDGRIDLLGEKIITTIPSSPLTDDILFNLKNSRAMASLTKLEVDAATTGKVQVNLPKRYLYYNSITLDRCCPDGWTKMAALIFAGPSSSGEGVQLKRMKIPYDSNMNSNFSDLRFLDSDGRRLLCFNIDTKSDGNYAYCTVLIPQMPASPALKTIYLIYGNSSATATSSSFSSDTMGADEPDIFQTIHVQDNFNDSSINTGIWTVSAPTGGTSVTETSGSMHVTVDSGITTSAFSTCPLFYTPTYCGDYEAIVKITNTSLNGDTEGGLFIMNTRSNVKAIKLWRNSSDTKYYIQDPTGANTEVVGGAYYLKITYRGGTYYFSYTPSLDTDWTTIYSTSSLGFTPTHIGMHAHHWGANQPQTIYYDDFTLKKGLGAESNLSDTSLDPDSGDEDDTELLFTLPGDWIPACMAYLNFTEGYSSEYHTPDISVSLKDILELGYSNGIDQYSAMRIRAEIEADSTCDIRINSEMYAYEVQ